MSRGRGRSSRTGRHANWSSEIGSFRHAATLWLNGEIEIFIERPNERFLVDLAEHIGTRQSGTASTNFEDISRPFGTKFIGSGDTFMPAILRSRSIRLFNWLSLAEVTTRFHFARSVSYWAGPCSNWKLFLRCRKIWTRGLPRS